MKKLLKIVARVLLAVAGLELVVLLVVSPVARRVVEKKSPEWIGRQVSMDHLRVSLLRGAVHLRGLNCSEADMQTRFVSVDTLYVNARLYKLLQHEVRLDHIHLSGLQVNVANMDTAFNFTDLIERFSSDPADTDTTPSNWGVGLYDIRLLGGLIAYSDLPRHSEWQLQNLNIYVPGIYLGGESSEGGLSFELPDGGRIATRAKFDQQANRYALDLSLQSINLAVARPYLTDYLNGTLDGYLSGNLNLDGSLDVVDNIQVGGTVSLDSVDLRDSERKSFLSLARASVSLTDVNPHYNRYHLSDLSLDSLCLNYEQIDENTTTLDRVLASSQNTPSADSTSAASSAGGSSQPTVFSITNFSLGRSSVHYADHTLRSPMSYTISSLTAKAGKISSTGQNDLTLRGHLPEGGTASVRWRGGLDYKHDDEQLTVLLKNVQLRHLSPYVEYYVGNKIDGGNLSLTSDNSIRSGQLRGTNLIDIYNLQVGRKKHKKEAEYGSVPLKAAVGILKDLNGKIAFNIPVEGDLNNPQFRYGKVIWQAIGNILLKATVSPFVAIGQALGMGGDGLDDINIDATQPDFSSQQYDRFASLVQICSAREDLVLVMEQQLPLADLTVAEGVSRLREGYYRERHGLGEAPLSMTDRENALQIKDKDSGFQAYVSRTTGSSKGSVADRSVNYFTADSLQAVVLRRADRRNAVLTDYFVNRMGLQPDRVVVRTADEAALRQYKNSARYAVTGEIRAVEPEE